MPHTLTVSWYGKQADVTFDTPTIDSLMQAAKKVQRFHMRDTDSTRNIVVGREDGDGTIGTRMVNDEDVKDALHIRCTVLMTRKALKRPKHEAQGVNMTDSEQVAKKRMTTIPTAKVLHTRILTEDDDMDARTLFMAGMMLTDQYGAPTSAPDVFSLLHDSAKVVTVTYVECRGKHFEVIKLHKEGASFPSWHCYDTAENCHVWRCVEALLRECTPPAENIAEDLLPHGVLRAACTPREWRICGEELQRDCAMDAVLGNGEADIRPKTRELV